MAHVSDVRDRFRAFDPVTLPQLRRSTAVSTAHRISHFSDEGSFEILRQWILSVLKLTQSSERLEQSDDEVGQCAFMMQRTQVNIRHVKTRIKGLQQELLQARAKARTQSRDSGDDRLYHRADLPAVFCLRSSILHCIRRGVSSSNELLLSDRDISSVTEAWSTTGSTSELSNRNSELAREVEKWRENYSRLQAEITKLEETHALERRKANAERISSIFTQEFLRRQLDVTLTEFYVSAHKSREWTIHLAQEAAVRGARASENEYLLRHQVSTLEVERMTLHARVQEVTAQAETLRRQNEALGEVQESNREWHLTDTRRQEEVAQLQSTVLRLQHD